jgi:hypothetical protein
MVFRQVWWKGEAESVLEEFCLGNFARDFDPHRLTAICHCHGFRPLYGYMMGLLASMRLGATYMCFQISPKLPCAIALSGWISVSQGQVSCIEVVKR